MTNIDQARDALDRAQTLLDETNAAVARLDEVLPWLEDLLPRVHRLGECYGEKAETDLRTVLQDDPEAVTPPVANEDAVWEAMANLDDRMLRLLRVVTAELTSGLDAGGSCMVTPPAVSQETDEA